MRLREGYDVVVCGGGTAGVIAGIASARTGAKTLLIEKYGSLGGALTLGMSLLGAADGGGYKALGGIGGELVERIEAEGMEGVSPTSVDPLFGSVLNQDPELAKTVLIDMALEAGLNLLLHTWVTGVLMDSSRVQAISAVNKGGTEIIPAKSFVDCTGDADLVANANGQFIFGREGDSLTQPVSRIFRVAGVTIAKVWDYLDDHPEDMSTPEGWTGESYSVGHLKKTPGATVEGFRSLIEKAEAAGDYTIPRDRLGIYTLPGRTEVGINITRVHGIDGTNPDDLSRAEIETQKQMLEAMRFLRKYVPGFEKAYIVSAPFQIGVRETRHIKGSYTLTKDDVMAGRDFEDQIARGAYPLDVHDVKPGAEVLGKQVRGGGVTLWKVNRSYGIPVRTLIPQGVDNITVGGRSISATHEAAGSVRGQAVCMVTGHAAGTVAALAALQNVKPDELSPSVIQSALREQRAILKRNVPLTPKTTFVEKKPK